ncbi:hypothetical protein FACS189483_02020 [Spirochaetia bacterium]|nr:hypothetical protein FACS189483_02020 [Spirochaetia bacterium]
MTPPLIGGNLGFPFWVYAGPNALFPLITFFLVLRPDEYRSYIPLYMGGKAVAIAANLGWFVFSYREIPGALASVGYWNVLAILAFAGLLLVLDAFSILGGHVLNVRFSRRLRAEQPVQLAGGNLPPSGDGSA